MCLTLCCRSPRGYVDLRDNGFVQLPSERLLHIYTNKVNQKPGINKELLHWMKNEALSRNLPPEGYEGGVLLDEMSIQSDLQFYSKDGVTYMTDLKELNDEADVMDCLLSGEKNICLASHVLQFAFLRLTGFRFPLFHFPTNQATASVSHILENCKHAAVVWF